MTEFRLALVEDREEDIKICQDSVSRYKDERDRDIELVVYRSVDEALEKLDNSFDGAIIDLRFPKNPDIGNEVARYITQSNLRIPVAIMTGTPANADSDLKNVEVYNKGEVEYVTILDQFWKIHDTGLTRIMGGRGKIEETLNRVYEENILPQKKIWIEYGKLGSERTERALLRHVLNHLLQLLEEDAEPSFPEEFYIHPPLSNGYRTGSIIKFKANGTFFAVVTPACDLVVRENGEFKTDRVLLVEIESTDTVLTKALNGITNNGKKKKQIESILGNKYTLYHHWLPQAVFFRGGVINFRKLTTSSQIELAEHYEPPKVQISPFFMKDVIARFSSFYARQGQPDIAIDREIERLLFELQG